MDAFIAVFVIIAVGAITPGPNTVLVMAAGARDGFGATLPLILGITGGGLALLALAWSGGRLLLQGLPSLHALLMLGGAAYLIWLGLDMIRRTSTEPVPGPPTAAGIPALRGALAVAALQLANPKAWALVLTATAAVASDSPDGSGFAVLASGFAAISLICLAIWACCGAVIGRRLAGSARRWFERALGGLLAASAALLVVA